MLRPLIFRCWQIITDFNLRGLPVFQPLMWTQNDFFWWDFCMLFFFARHCYNFCDNVLAKRSWQLPALWGMGEAGSKGGFLLAPPTRPFSSLLLLLYFQVPSLCLSLAEEGCRGSISTLQRAIPLMSLQNGSRARCHLLLLPPFTWHTHFAQHTILFLSLVFVFVWGQELPAGKWDGSSAWAWVSSHLPPQSLIVTFPLILSLCLPHASISLSMESS